MFTYSNVPKIKIFFLPILSAKNPQIVEPIINPKLKDEPNMTNSSILKSHSLFNVGTNNERNKNSAPSKKSIKLIIENCRI